MAQVKKLWWTIRAVLLKPFLGSVGLPSYVGPTLLILRPRRLHLGRRVRIMPGMRAEAHGDGTITIGDNVSIGQGFHITAMGDLSVGAGTLILPYVMMTDIDHEYEAIGVPVLEQPYRLSPTRVGENCFIGMSARLQAGTVLGDGCVVGANSVVRGTFPPHSVIVGAPARIVRRYDPTTETWVRETRERTSRD